MEAPFVAVADAADLPPGQLLKVRVGARAYLIAHVAGQYYAVEDRCSHEDYPLSYGCLEGARIKCSLHGSRFALHDGAPLEPPADTPIATFRVVVAEDRIWLDPSAPREPGA